MHLKNEILSEHTTLRIGGPAEVFAYPESVEELTHDVAHCVEKGIRFRTIGRGSNLLVSDQGVPGYVFNLQNCCNSIGVRGRRVIAGAGVTLQKFIKTSVAKSLYGNEFLMSVPGTVGGAIVMNAGTWTDLNTYISDYLEEVRILDGETVRSLRKPDCRFGYRRSIFLENPHWIILDASFNLPEQDQQEGERKIKERMEWSLEYQDVRYASAGSIFSTGHGRCLEWLKHVQFKRAGWSKKTGNWINNYGSATCRDILSLIRVGRLAHLAVGMRPKLEICIWK
jgi:UDP-N-acetylmuramate dehydrogenase